MTPAGAVARRFSADRHTAGESQAREGEGPHQLHDRSVGECTSCQRAAEANGDGQGVPDRYGGRDWRPKEANARALPASGLRVWAGIRSDGR